MENIKLIDLNDITLEAATAWAALGLYFVIKDGHIFGLTRK